MRQTTAASHAALRAAEESDERLAQKHEKHVAFLERLSRATRERGDDLKRALDDFVSSTVNEIAVMCEEKRAVIAELRGNGAAPAAPPAPAMPPVIVDDAPAGAEAA